MPLNWINPEDFPFNSFLLMDRFQIRLMTQSSGWDDEEEKKAEWRRDMGVALNANPAVSLSEELVSRGWEPMYYKGTLGGDVYRYRKQVEK